MPLIARPPARGNELGNAEQTTAGINRVARCRSQAGNEPGSSSGIQCGLDDHEEVRPRTDQSQEEQDHDSQDRMEFGIHQSQYARNMLPFSLGSQQWHN